MTNFALQAPGPALRRRRSLAYADPTAPDHHNAPPVKTGRAPKGTMISVINEGDAINSSCANEVHDTCPHALSEVAPFPREGILVIFLCRCRCHSPCPIGTRHEAPMAAWLTNCSCLGAVRIRTTLPENIEEGISRMDFTHIAAPSEPGEAISRLTGHSTNRNSTNQQSFRRLLRTTIGLLALTVGLAAGAYLTDHIVQIILAILGAIVSLFAAYSAAISISIWVLLRAERVFREDRQVSH